MSGLALGHHPLGAHDSGVVDRLGVRAQPVGRLRRLRQALGGLGVGLRHGLLAGPGGCRGDHGSLLGCVRQQRLGVGLGVLERRLRPGLDALGLGMQDGSIVVEALGLLPQACGLHPGRVAQGLGLLAEPVGMVLRPLEDALGMPGHVTDGGGWGRPHGRVRWACHEVRHGAHDYRLGEHPLPGAPAA